MVKEENRATFIKHLVTFTIDYDIDGFEFDWEYPGEPDIPGIPAGSDDEGANIVYYNNTWMAFMDSTERAWRTKNYSSYNFLGTSEWAIDLEAFTGDVDDSEEIWDCPDAGLFADLDEISANSSIPSDCFNYYILSVMAANMTASLQAYTDLMNDDYEEKLKYYSKAVKSAAPDQWTSFYDNDYDNLTTCEWLGPKDGDPDSTEYLNQTGGCPPNDEPSFVTKNAAEVGFTLYTLFPNKTEFENVAVGTYGLDLNWINYNASKPQSQYCKITDAIGKTIGECSEGQVPIWHQPALYSSLTVDDPSTIITSALPNYQNVSNWLNDMVMEMGAGSFTANDVDAIDAMSVSVYTVDAAIAQMQQVSEIGEEVEEAEKKAREESRIFFFISALLLLIPGLGEELDAILDTTFLARVATMIGDAGDAALTLYTVYEDPDSAPIAIVGLLIGGAISREDAIFASAAKLRRAMSADDVAALGARAESNLKKIENLKQTCRV